MKRQFVLLFCSLFLAVSLQAQFAKPLKSTTMGYRNASSFNMGLTGSFAANDLLYSAVSKSMLTPYLAPTVGLAFEWNTLRRFSVGLDASYAMRGGNKAFATEFLTSYTTTTFARINYTMDLTGVEVHLPVSFYLGYSEYIRPYLFVAPRFDLWLNGNVRWERTYDDKSYDPLVYETELNNATIAPYDLGAVAGFGVCSRLKMGRNQIFLKFDLSYGISVFSNFSEKEVQAANVAHSEASAAKQGDFTFQGWGDIEHETLGQRHLQDVEVRLTVLMPLRKPLQDACAFDQRMRRPK